MAAIKATYCVISSDMLPLALVTRFCWVARRVGRIQIRIGRNMISVEVSGQWENQVSAKVDLSDLWNRSRYDIGDLSDDVVSTTAQGERRSEVANGSDPLDARDHSLTAGYVAFKFWPCSDPPHFGWTHLLSRQPFAPLDKLRAISKSCPSSRGRLLACFTPTRSERLNSRSGLKHTYLSTDSSHLSGW